METLHVDLADRSYPIFIGSGLLGNPELIKPYIKGNSSAIVSNTTVAPIYIDSIHNYTQRF